MLEEFNFGNKHQTITDFIFCLLQLMEYKIISKQVPHFQFFRIFFLSFLNKLKYKSDAIQEIQQRLVIFHSVYFPNGFMEILGCFVTWWILISSPSEGKLFI